MGASVFYEVKGFPIHRDKSIGYIASGEENFETVVSLGQMHFSAC